MTHRRKFLESISASALAASWFRGAALARPLPAPDDAAYWDKVRGQFMLARDKVFFNNGTIGATPRVVFEKTVDHLRKMAVDIADWDYRGDNWIAGYGDPASLRGKLAGLLNAGEKEVALTENVTCSNSYVADGIELEKRAEIVMSDQEHPGGEGPWLTAAKRHGGAVTRVKLPKPAHTPGELVSLVIAAFTPRTRVLFLSHVITGSGAIVPVKEICAEARSRGIFTVIDGAQAFGHIPVDVKDIGCDAYVGCLHKWILAPAGNGFLFLRQDKAPAVWTTLPSSNWDNHGDDGYRLSQRGTGSLSLLVGAEAAVDFHLELGHERVLARVKYLGDRLRAGLREMTKVKIYSPEDNAMCAGITVYAVDGVTGDQLQDEMWNRARLRPRSSGPGVRHSTHIFNSPAEVDKALEVVHALARG
ncbi:MAG: aminotransferase class V-fold PLP-dependent enzyme [Bryobacteraceae bacterium]|jgi:selenocysteine lyase/cysteine desulfurase